MRLMRPKGMVDRPRMVAGGADPRGSDARRAVSEPWIRVHANLAGKPIVWRACEALGVKPHEAMGLLVQFWGAVSQHATHGCVSDIPDAQIEAWAGWTRKRGLFASFIRDKHLDPDGRVREWDEYAGALETRKEHDRERKRKERERTSRGQSTGRHADSPQEMPVTSAPTIRNDTKRTTKASAPDGAMPASWTARIAAVWAGDVGPVPTGRIGKALKPLVDKHGEDRVDRAMRAYIAVRKGDGKPCNINFFAGEGEIWLERTKEPLGVIDGEYSDTLELLSRPAAKGAA